MNNNKNDIMSDTEYINHMIPHHQLAVDMSEQIIPHTKSDVILGLSRDIIRKQNYEIWEMANMVGYSKNNSDTNKHSTKNMKMNEIQYLQHMIPHHQIAIDMSKKLLLYTKNEYLLNLANKIIIDQQMEIFRMKGLLGKNTVLNESELV